MPLIKTISPPDGLIGIWQITENSTDLFPLFSQEEFDDPGFLKYTFEKRKVEWLVTRLLIKQLIDSDFTVSYSDSGKPIIEHYKYKHLSISHSRHFVAVFLHENLNVGLDIEETNRNYNAVEERYLSKAEMVFVNKNATLQCLCWCAKEAIFKLVPEDGIEFKDQILIDPFNPETENDFTARFITENRQISIQLHFQSFASHCIVWVTG